jgi:epsilon-lactone hydrolase
VKTIKHSLNPKDRESMTKMRAFAATRKGGAFDRPAYDKLVEQTPNAPDVAYEEGKVGGVAGWWCLPKGLEKSAVILYLHGGGYILGSAKAYRNFAGQVASHAGVRAFVVDYRLAPEHIFPAAVDDSVAAFKGLSQDFGSVAVVGDSAGGGLALALAEETKLAKRPAAVVVLSPMTDLALTGETIIKNAGADFVLNKFALATAASQYLGPEDVRNPRASPLYGDLTGLPPISTHVGGDEILLDDSRRFSERAGGDIALHIWEGMPHVFPQNVGVLVAAEEALVDMGAFIYGHVNHRRQSG